MLSRDEFIKESLEVNLFFSRIMKEHMIFLAAGFTPKDANLAQEADVLKNQFSMLLGETITLAQGNVSQEVVCSGELVTKDTLKAEMVTQYYTGIPIDLNLTNAELALVGDKCPTYMPYLEDRVCVLNQKALSLVNAAIQFKSKVVCEVLACRMYTHIYPHMLEHVLKEARFYCKLLMELQKREKPGFSRDAAEQELFWNKIMGEHGEFIRGMLDPTEKKLIMTADKFTKEYDELESAAKAAINNSRLLPRVTGESLDETVCFRDFKRKGVEGILSCKIKGLILPLLADHVLREANFYIRILTIIRVKL